MTVRPTLCIEYFANSYHKFIMHQKILYSHTFISHYSVLSAVRAVAAMQWWQRDDNKRM